MFPDHKGMKIEINSRDIRGKVPNTWILDNIYLNNP